MKTWSELKKQRLSPEQISESKKWAKEEAQKLEKKDFCGRSLRGGEDFSPDLSALRLCGGCVNIWAERVKEGNDDLTGIGCGLEFAK